MIRSRFVGFAAWGISVALATLPAAAFAGGHLGLGHHGVGHHGTFVVGVPVQGAAVSASPLTVATAGTMAVTSALSTASFGSSVASVNLASGPVVYYTPTAMTTSATAPVTSPLSTATAIAPVAAPITSPLSGAGVASSATAPLSLAGINTGSIIAEYNRFAEMERVSALSQASMAGTGMAGVSVAANELSSLNSLFPELVQKVGGVGNLHGLIRFLKTKTGNPDEFQKTARGLFGEVLGGALKQAPEVALNLLGNSVDAMIRQYIPGFSLFSQPPSSGGTLFGAGGPGSSPSNPLFVRTVSSDAPVETRVPARPQPETRPDPVGTANRLLDFIRNNSNTVDLNSLQVAPDGSIKGKFKDGREIQPGGGPPVPPSE